MKKQRGSYNQRACRGFAAMPMVSFMAIFLVLSLALVYRSSIIKRDQAAKSQLRIDYHQREEAMMRALVAVFPSKVSACMRGNYAESNAYNWNAVFTEAIQSASSSVGISNGMKSAMGLSSSVRKADVGDDTDATVLSWITSINGEPGKVTPGTSAYEADFVAAGLADRIPPLLTSTAALDVADEDRPVVSSEKVYGTQSPEIFSNVTSYPNFGLISYPNIRFGYAEPGQPFVAKRNWWAFSVTYGDGGVGVTKNYILSLYEVPSQLPIEASTFAEIGKHANGVSWGSGINIQGGVYADRLQMDGAHGASRLAGRESIDLGTSGLQLNGTTVDNDFDELGVREAMNAEAKTNILPVALSANSGRVVFYPIPSGLPFLKKFTGTPTMWDRYKGGAIGCKITVTVNAMVSLADQTPTAMTVTFDSSTGGTKSVTLERSGNWPTALAPGGSVIPFQTELTSDGRSCLTVYPELLNAWLLSQGGASVETNSSMHISIDPTATDSLVPSTPPSVDDMNVVIRRGENLTGFPKGFSLLGALRVYIGDDLNEVPMPSVPTNAGFPSGTTEYYPPLSIFAQELRVGTTSASRLFSHTGQMGSLQSTGASTAWKPMDIKSGKDEALMSTADIEADLKPLVSPAELPPIYQMNWLVVVEEIQSN